MWFIYLSLFFIGSASAGYMTDEEAKVEFTKYVMACVPENPVDMTDLVKLQALSAPNKREIKCLLACTYRKIGTLNSDGTFDLQKSYKLAEDTKQGDADAIKRGKKLADACNIVNDEKVSDGSKGCERSYLMFKCFIENAPKFGFTV